MKFVIQRVSRGAVAVRDETRGSIKKGLVVLVGVQRGDGEEEIEWMVKKVLRMRIFEDDDGKMNRSVMDTRGALLLIPNFTLYADVTQGNRPGFTKAEAPEKAKVLYNKLVSKFQESDLVVESGTFGANMDLELINDGPVTVVLEKEANE